MNAHRNTIHLSAKIALSVCVLLIASAQLSAGTISASELPKITMGVAGSSSVWDYSPPVGSYVPSTDGDGSYELSYEQHSYGVCDHTANVVVKDLQFNSDPFVLNNILVTNTTATTQIYSVTVGLPTTFGAPNLIKGTVTTSVIDGDASGSATLSTVPLQPIYKGQIDFATVATLQNDPFSVTTPGSSSATDSFGLNPNAVAVLSSIGIQLTFQLTAGDTASILSRFDVVVPEPTCLALVGVAVAFLLGVRRRTSR